MKSAKGLYTWEYIHIIEFLLLMSLATVTIEPFDYFSSHRSYNDFCQTVSLGNLSTCLM